MELWPVPPVQDLPPGVQRGPSHVIQSGVKDNGTNLPGGAGACFPIELGVSLAVGINPWASGS